MISKEANENLVEKLDEGVNYTLEHRKFERIVAAGVGFLIYSPDLHVFFFREKKSCYTHAYSPIFLTPALFLFLITSQEV